MRAQSKRMSMIETATNVVVGLATSFAVQWLVFPWFGIYVSHSTNAGITAIFFVASLIRLITMRSMATQAQSKTNYTKSLRSIWKAFVS